MTVVLLLIVLPLLGGVHSSGILYPRASETRDLISLDGLWNFAVTNTTDPMRGHLDNWFRVNFNTIDLDVQKMPVPSSYNDVGTDTSLRDHVGPVWYQRSFFVPKGWSGQKVWIRFSSVCRAAEVWINDEWVVSHDIGHLPFQAEISKIVNFGAENTITVTVDNTLTATTIPQGSISELISGRVKQSYTFDFFNYAGIDRPVVLYTTPATYIDDITVTTDIDGTNGFINYSVVVEGSDKVTTKVSLLDKTGKEVASDTVLTGILFVQNATFWWPYLMDPNPGYLYSLQVQLLDASSNLVDKYTLPVGIRVISWNSTSVTINKKPIYLRGFGRHEDSDLRGKGLDLPLIIRDYNLIKWIGANAYRTSHYPYAEEIMDLADEFGIMIIDESPAVNTENFSNELLENHKKSLTELIQRDKNRPSVIIWSAANEPRTQYNASEAYYKEVVAHIKSLDTTRPVTVVNNQLPDSEYSGKFIDIASCNVYYGWYSNTGDIDVVTAKVKEVATRWNKLHNIPVIMTEYGADTQEGLHLLPAYSWSEEYQNTLLSQYFQAFDQMREEGFFIGEMIWNFADFKTAQTYTRVGGNKKGIFTRNRQPKASAHLLRKRYWALAQNLDNAEVPDDLNEYIINTKTVVKDEL
ncbi:beta-glucuronidase [Tribolium castaneum]|uniref:Beta-glucuronidase n=1 Tax=Tribolium castaneum TaxID=7070 RepID=D6WYY7_TRICA|nr:PREDICTED: beta-glucuronidase [Tribolium castaneum]EFA07842.1 Beta-glucuronidase-like Protein [Tribolium castaneum]|eukprot:XP_969353.1 PREDICTED: beta-glucuronidase [Tribolium castaneum]